MGPRKLPTEIESELRQAQAALAEGNDGKARACARRAVGKAFSLSKYSGSDVCRSALSATEFAVNVMLKLVIYFFDWFAPINLESSFSRTLLSGIATPVQSSKALAA